jgi:membrane associated rhomboid family serine protease
MIPIRDENPTMHTSAVTYAIIIANAAVWVFIQGLGTREALISSVYAFGLIPAELFGGRIAPVQAPLPEAATVITSMFMHGGWFHIIGNMWFLGIFGDNVEDAMGPVAFALFYIVCGIAAAAAQVLTGPGSTVPMVGASGAVGGVMGAYFFLFPTAPVHMLVFFGFLFFRIVVPAFIVLGYWFVIQFFNGMLTIGGPGVGVAFWAHIGGFAAGYILVRFLCSTERMKNCRQKRGTVKRVYRVRR